MKRNSVKELPPALVLALLFGVVAGCAESQSAAELASGVWEVDVVVTNDSLILTSAIEEMGMELSIVGPQKLEGQVSATTADDMGVADVECFVLQEPEEGNALMRCRDTSSSRDFVEFVDRVFEWEEGKWLSEIEPGAYWVMERP